MHISFRVHTPGGPLDVRFTTYARSCREAEEQVRLYCDSLEWRVDSSATVQAPEGAERVDLRAWVAAIEADARREGDEQPWAAAVVRDAGVACG